jgi:hypothetical protein
MVSYYRTAHKAIPPGDLAGVLGMGSDATEAKDAAACVLNPIPMMRSLDIAQSAIVECDKERVFKVKTFTRWARKVVSDEALCAVLARSFGRYEADLEKAFARSASQCPAVGKVARFARLWRRKEQTRSSSSQGDRRRDPGSDFSDAHVAQAQWVGEGLCRLPATRNLISWWQAAY